MFEFMFDTAVMIRALREQKVDQPTQKPKMKKFNSWGDLGIGYEVK